MKEVLGHSPRGSVDWNLQVRFSVKITSVTPHVGVWIETSIGSALEHYDDSHSPRGSVDWNRKDDTILIDKKVTPHVGVWIETWLTLVR